MLPLRPWVVVVNPPRPTIWRWPERRSWSSLSPVQQPSADQRFSVQSTTHLPGFVLGVCIGAVGCPRFGGRWADTVSGGWVVGQGLRCMGCGWPVEIDTAVQVWLYGRQRPGFGEVLVAQSAACVWGRGLGVCLWLTVGTLCV